MAIEIKYDAVLGMEREKDIAVIPTLTTADVADSLNKRYVTDVELGDIGTIDDKLTGNVAIVGATKTKITYDAKGLVTFGDNATTADIADSTNKRYVTDANLVSISEFNGSFTSSNSTNFAWTDNTLSITHNLGKQFVVVEIYDNNNVLVDYTLTGTSTSVVTISFPIGAIPITGTYNVRIR